MTMAPGGEKIVYFLRPVGARGPVKIGVTSNLEERLRSAQTFYPAPIECAATYPGAEGTEAAFHRMFAAHRQHGEWFAACDEIEAAIEAINAGAFALSDSAERASDRPLLETFNGTALAVATGLSDFLGRCDAYCAKFGVSQTWLSKRLFADTYWLSKLADGSAGVTVKRFERAKGDLQRLERGEPVNRGASAKSKLTERA